MYISRFCKTTRLRVSLCCLLHLLLWWLLTHQTQLLHPIAPPIPLLISLSLPQKHFGDDLKKNIKFICKCSPFKNGCSN